MSDDTSIQTNRRTFLGRSGTLATGVALASGLTPLKAAFASGSDTIRLGLVGCGLRGTSAAAQAMKTAGPTKLVAMADAFDDRLQGSLHTLNRQHADKVDVSVQRRFTGFDAYKHVLAQDIDLVILATPPGFRPLHFDAAVKAGKHVFMEKPVAVDGAGVRKVLEAAKMSKEKGLLVQVGLQRRHERAYMSTMARLREGAIGEIVLARAYWNASGVWTRPRKQEQTEMEYQMRNWYYFNWLSGDHIVEQHVHNLDVINWLKDDYPVKAQGQGGREVRDGIDNGEIFDHHFVEFTYQDGTKLFSQCRHIPNCWNSQTEYAHGTKGYCDISDATIRGPNGKETWAFGKGGGGGHQQEHHDLFADLRAGRLPNEAEYGAMSTMTSVLGRLATYSGKQVSMTDALRSDCVVSPVEKFTSFSDTPPVVPDENGRYPIAVPGETEVL